MSKEKEAEKRLKQLESKLNQLIKQLDEDSVHFQVLLKIVRQHSDDEKKYLEGKMEKDEYIKKLEEFEETLMGTILRFYRFKG